MLSWNGRKKRRDTVKFPGIHTKVAERWQYVNVLSTCWKVVCLQSSFLNHSSSSNSLAVGLSLQSIIIILPMNCLSFLQTSFSVVRQKGVVSDCGISCISHRIALTVIGGTMSSYFPGNGPKYRNCCLRTSSPYSSWPYGTVFGRKRLKFPPYIRLISYIPVD